jgi:phospholipase C
VLTRRDFLQLTGGSAALGALSCSVERAASIDAPMPDGPRSGDAGPDGAPSSTPDAAPRAGSIEDIAHIVVLMQENRSFDHYFGGLRGVRGFGDPRPVTLPSGRSVWHQASGATTVLPFRPVHDDLGLAFLEGLNHDWAGGHAALHGGKYDRWIPAKTPTTMAYLTRADIPFHYALADAFTICDAYHCSFIGATDPNRYYMWTGHTGNDGAGGGPVLGNEEAGYDWMTYPERLEAAGISWKIYQDIGDGLDAAGSWGWIGDAYRGNYGDNSLLYFNRYRNAAPGSPLYEKARTGTNAAAGDGYFDRLQADVMAGTLPQISWIAAPEAFTEHSNWPANYGAWYIARVLDALTSNPAVWARTALFITYDENDGFFDHVVPPYPPASAAQGLSTVAVDGELHGGNLRYAAGHYGLGPRVPMLVVSPWSKGGYVCSETFDHTSLLQFMERRFGVHEPNISPWRRAICGDLTSAFDFGRVDAAPGALPDTARYEPPDRARHPDYEPAPPRDPALPVQEPGSRPTRPLPYALVVDAAVIPATGKVELRFASEGTAGASFYITSGNRTDVPWTYTVDGGASVADQWSTAGTGGVYDLAVHGPNGFLRQFRGPARAAGTEATARGDAATGNLRITLRNDGDRDATLTVTDAYGGASQRQTLAPGASRELVIDLQASQRWYDVSVTSDVDGGFLRRYAGHVETGRSGVSDPAIITAS